jgi:hypothetical protein
MALIAAIEFGDNDIKRYSKQYLVSDCQFAFSKKFNEFRPEGLAHCEKAEVVVVAPGKNDLTLFDWYSSGGVQSGRILISLSTESKTDTDDAQVIYFEDARCISFSERYDIDSSRRRLLHIGIKAEKMTVDNVVFNR